MTSVAYGERFNYCTFDTFELVSTSPVIMHRMVGGKYKLGRKIGSGSFGELYLGMQFPQHHYFCKLF